MKMRLSHGSSLVISSGATTMITNTTTGDGASQRQLWAFELAGRLQMEWMLSRVTDLLLWPPVEPREATGGASHSGLFSCNCWPSIHWRLTT